jgi:hypothetical protein
MQRVFGAIAILAGWMTVPAGAFSGLVASQFFGLTHVEGALAPSAVYGISGEVVLWSFIAAAMLLTLPAITAMVAPDPRRPLGLIAAAMAVAGLVLLPDELGRAFGLPLLAGAVLMVVGGNLIHKASVAESIGSATVRQQPLIEALNSPAASQSDPRSAGPNSEPSTTNAPVAAATQPAPRRSRRSAAGTQGQRTCPWCSGSVPAGAAVCPNCQATLDEPAMDGMGIPGLTELPSDLRRYAEAVRTKKKRPSLLRVMFSDDSVPSAADTPAPSDADALQPPSSALKAEMARLDAEIASGGAFIDEAAAPENTAPPAGERPARTRKPRPPRPRS